MESIFINNVLKDKNDVLSVYCPSGFNLDELVQWLFSQIKESGMNDRLYILSNLLYEVNRYADTYHFFKEYSHIFCAFIQDGKVVVKMDHLKYDKKEFSLKWSAYPDYSIFK